MSYDMNVLIPNSTHTFNASKNLVHKMFDSIVQKIEWCEARSPDSTRQKLKRICYIWKNSFENSILLIVNKSVDLLDPDGWTKSEAHIVFDLLLAMFSIVDLFCKWSNASSRTDISINVIRYTLGGMRIRMARTWQRCQRKFTLAKYSIEEEHEIVLTACKLLRLAKYDQGNTSSKKSDI